MLPLQKDARCETIPTVPRLLLRERKGPRAEQLSGFDTKELLHQDLGVQWEATKPCYHPPLGDRWGQMPM
jgi:hypothetical protein